jgi:signal transduction histidine kinase
MSTRQLRLLSIVLPVLFWAAFLSFRTLVTGETRSLEDDAFALVAIGLGSAAFSSWVFGIVESQASELKLRAEQLDALREASIALTTELDLGLVLQRVVDVSRSLVHTRYAALGVLDEEGQYIEQFITSGLDPLVRAQIGELPRGHGLLGVLITEGKPIVIPEIDADPRSVGFPPNHPPMHSLLGVPIRSKGKVIGDLYLTDKIAQGKNAEQTYTVFDLDDLRIAEMFATQAAIAIENAQLYRKTQQLAILQERQRFGMDLHDGIIQAIYAIGLSLEEADLIVDTNAAETHALIRQGLRGMNDVIRDIRNYILDLRPQRFQGRDLRHGLEELARELRANTLLTIDVDADDWSEHGLLAEQTVDLLHIAQEAMTNAAKHARATRLIVSLDEEDGYLLLSFADDGRGFDFSQAKDKGGYGLRNMRERAAALGGDMQVDSGLGQGTRLEIRVPLNEDGRN